MGHRINIIRDTCLGAYERLPSAEVSSKHDNQVPLILKHPRKAAAGRSAKLHWLSMKSPSD
jgi:hypothetical protein